MKRCLPLLLTLGLIPAGITIPLDAADNPRYQLVENWAHFPTEVTKWGQATGVDVDSHDNVYVFHRHDRMPIMAFDKHGNFIRAWGQGMFKTTHFLRVDRSDAVWVTDRGHMQAFKFNRDGKLLLTLGKQDVLGDNTSHDTFNGMADLAVARNGDIFVADGEGPNTRVARFSKDGAFQKWWGGKGAEPGQFNMPHSIAVDARDRVYVADRSNNRVQIFDKDGKFLNQWTNVGVPWGLFIRGDRMYLVDGSDNNCLLIMDLKDGRVLEKIGGLSNPTAVAVDSTGAIYVGEVNGTNVKKFVKAAPSSAASTDAVTPFAIHVPDDVLRDLAARLARVRYPDELENAGWDYGMNLGYLKELVAYWRDKFDWRAQERRLNQFTQYKTRIDGLDIHFIHQRSKNPNARPLLLLNGWPSTIDEYSKVIGPLTDPESFGGRAEDAFHVVVPSMPGYGFSDKPRGRGYGNQRITADWVTLMARLGYSRYGVQGTDIGAGIATELAVDDAAHVMGLHLTGCGGGAAPAPANAGAPGAVPGSDTLGYFELQATKPQTIGYSLSDSPVGLAAWIVEKYHGWSDHDGDVEKVYTKDQLLTAIMFYWVTDSGASSARIYYERRHQPAVQTGRVNVPTGCANFNARYDKRPVAGTRTAAETRYNVVRWTDMPRGGHFPAFEQPQLWTDDVRAFFRGLR